MCAVFRFRIQDLRQAGQKKNSATGLTKHSNNGRVLILLSPGAWEASGEEETILRSIDQIRKRNGQAFIRMLLSYLLLLCVPVLICAVLSLYTYQVVAGQSEIFSNNMIGTVEKTCGNEIQVLNNTLRQLKVDEKIAKLGNTQSDYWNEAQVKKDLVSAYAILQETDPYCESVFVYMKNHDKIISQFSSMSVAYFSDQLSIDETMLREILAQDGLRSQTSVGLRGGGKEYILFLEPVIHRANASQNTVVGIVLSTAGLERKISSLDWDGDIEWLIADEDGALLRRPGSMAIDSLDLDRIENDSSRVTIEGKKYIVSQAPGALYRWTYLLLIQESMVDSPAKHIRSAMLLGLVATMVCGCALSLWLSRKQYQPLQQLMGLFQGTEKGRDEYAYIQDQVSQILEKARTAEKDKRKGRQRLRIHALEKLLLSPKADLKTEEELAFCEKFRDGRNLILLCCPEEPAAQAAENEEDPEEKQLRRFIISNVFEERIGERFPRETFLYEDMVVSIIHLPDGCEDYSDQLEDISGELQAFIFQNFSFHVRSVESESHEGLAGIRQAWVEACYALSFAGRAKDFYIRYQDVKESAIFDYAYPIELEEQVISAVRSGNEVLAKTLIDRVLEESFGKGSTNSAELRSCILYDILGTLLKVSEKQGIRVEKLPGVNQINANTKLTKVRAYFYEIIESICAKLRIRDQEIGGQGLSSLILDYVAESYADPDLNISQIAQKFHMTPAWLSSSFKAQTGRSLLSVIKKVRMEHALEYLDSGMSVQEVAQRVGFRDDTTFIRTFKAYYGTTPGQIKKPKP